MLKRRSLSLITIALALLWGQHLLASQKMIHIKGGDFTPLYGTKKLSIRMTDFEMDEYPVTNAEFLEFVQQHPEWRRSAPKRLFVDKSYLQHWSGDLELGTSALPEGPVISVSWYAAKAYCETKGKTLPSVNQWEYVASLPIDGVDIKKLILDWYSESTPDIIPSVKSGKRNASGVSSMHGLIWEWNLDFNSALVTGESRGDASLDKTMYCGAGSNGAADASDYAAFLRFGFRSSLKANYTVRNLGFRCVK